MFTRVYSILSLQHIKTDDPPWSTLCFAGELTFEQELDILENQTKVQHN